MATRKERQEKELFCQWSKKEKDIMYWFPSRPDGHLLHNVLSTKLRHDEKSFIEELESRGYDIKTIKFSIKKKV